MTRFRTLQSMAVSALLLAVCTTPLFAQDAPQLPDSMLGEWMIDFDTMAKADPDLAALTQEQLAAQMAMMKGMLGAARIVFTQDLFSMNGFMGQNIVSTLEVKSVEGDTATFVATRKDNGEVQELTATLTGKKLVVTDGSRPMHLMRVPAVTETPTLTTPSTPENQMVGDWELDIEATMEATMKKNPEMTDDEQAELKAELDNEASTPSMTITKDKLTLRSSGEESTADLKVVSSEGKKVKLAVTAGETVNEVDFEMFDKDTLHMPKGGNGSVIFVFKRKQDSTTTPGIEVSGILGTWSIDVEATIKGDPNNANLSEEELKMALMMAGAMLSQMKCEFTEDKMFIVMMGGAKTPTGSYKIIEQDGDKLTVEVTDLEGVTSTNTWTLTEDRLVAEVNGSPMHLFRQN